MTTTDEIMELADVWMVARLQTNQTWSDVDIARNRLKTAIEALAADAARYNWIKEHCILGIYQNGNGWHMSIDGIAPDSKRDIDSAVDAAMKESQ